MLKSDDHQLLLQSSQKSAPSQIEANITANAIRQEVANVGEGATPPVRNKIKLTAKTMCLWTEGEGDSLDLSMGADISVGVPAYVQMQLIGPVSDDLVLRR